VPNHDGGGIGVHGSTPRIGGGSNLLSSSSSLLASTQPAAAVARSGASLLAPALPALPAGPALPAPLRGGTPWRFVGVNPRYSFRMASTRHPEPAPALAAAAGVGGTAGAGGVSSEAAPGPGLAASAHEPAHGNEDLLGGGGATRPRSFGADEAGDYART